MTQTIYLLQASSQVRITKIREQIQKYNSKTKELDTSLELMPGLYLGLYYTLIVKGNLSEEKLKENRLLNYLFNLKKKSQSYSFQKLSEKEAEKVLSGIITKSKTIWRIGDRIIFPMGEGEGEGNVLEVIDDQSLIVGFSTGGRNKIRVDSSRCKRK